MEHLKKHNHGAEKTFPHFEIKKMWPPSSPGLNLLNFSIWSMLKKDACHSEKRSVNHLKQSLQKAWADILQKKICAAVEVFRSRLEKVIDANGAKLSKNRFPDQTYYLIFAHTKNHSKSAFNIMYILF